MPHQRLRKGLALLQVFQRAALAGAQPLASHVHSDVGAPAGKSVGAFARAGVKSVPAHNWYIFHESDFGIGPLYIAVQPKGHEASYI